MKRTTEGFDWNLHRDFDELSKEVLDMAEVKYLGVWFDGGLSSLITLNKRRGNAINVGWHCPRRIRYSSFLDHGE